MTSSPPLAGSLVVAAFEKSTRNCCDPPVVVTVLVSDQFWNALHDKIGFDRTRTLFIDDNQQVRAAARSWGIAYLFGIARPDSQGPEVSATDCRALEDFAELTGA